MAPTDYHLLTIDIPDALVAGAFEIDEATLPATWREENSMACQLAGMRWLTAIPHAVICRTPSAVMPGARNMLVDAAHAGAAAVRVAGQHLFSFDPRLLP